MLADSIAEMIGGGVIAPAVIALAVDRLSSRLLPQPAASRFPAVMGLLAGFVIGFVLLTEWDALPPARHWHWLPWVALVAGFAGAVAVSAGTLSRWLLMLGTSAAAAWFLAPTWTNLNPPRVVWLVGLSAGLCVLIGLMDPLPTRCGGRLVLGLSSLIALTTAATIAACVSVTYARIAGAAACALGGVWVGACLRQRDDQLAVRAALPAAMALIGGIAFVACVESERPQYGLLLLPIAPLGLWISQIRALRQLSGRQATILQIASVVIPLLAAAAGSYARIL
jgi:hypothetical protein